jgi:hypothetical protein
MARKKKKSHSWIDIKKNIKNFNKDQLIELVGDLYRLSENNKEFFHTRFLKTENPLKSYKRIIRDSTGCYGMSKTLKPTTIYCSMSYFNVGFCN